MASTVLPKSTSPTEAEFHDLLVAGLARVAAKIGKPALAKAMGRSTRQFDNVLGGSTPDAVAVFDALLADPTVLDELMASYGFRLCPLHMDAANDMRLGAGLSEVVSDIIRAHDDGNRDHRETLAIADKLRPLIPAAQGIVREADQIRGVA